MTPPTSERPIESPVVDGRDRIVIGSFETKYAIDGREVGALRRWLRSVCQPDPIFPSGVVNSIYFDTHAMRHLDEKINSDYLKTKIRLRWYDMPDGESSAPFLEAKFRIGQRRRKIRLPLGPDGARLTQAALHDPSLLAIPWRLRAEGVPVSTQLRPILAIRYQRHRFVDRVSRTRISLDSAIGVPAVNQEILPPPPPLPLRTAVVEVKGAGRALPGVLTPLAHLGGRVTAFSKYRACYDHTVTGATRG